MITDIDAYCIIDCIRVLNTAIRHIAKSVILVNLDN